MHAQRPLISVIIPVYNGDRYLAEAIESILGQTYQPIEIIVMDDGSTDNTAIVAKSFGSQVQYHYHINIGLAETRNHGVEVAQGEFFAFLDADDIWSPDKLSQQMNAFANDIELHMVFGLAQQFISPELDQSIQQKIHCTSTPVSGLCCSAMLVKKDAFSQVGKFNSNWKIGEFLDWYARAKEHGLKSYILPEIVMKRRLHDENMGIRDIQHRGDYMRIIKVMLDRRRQAKG